jgi:hypothetical protein
VYNLAYVTDADTSAGKPTTVNHVHTYLDRLFEVRSTRRGTPELSYRAALENLLNAVGQQLDPEVHATAELADTGAGRPDFGLIEAKSGNLRGVVEVKGPDEDTPTTADGQQVTRYGRHYGCVLVTNYRDFLLVCKQRDGSSRVEARYQLAVDAESFWHSKPSKLAKEHAEGLSDFLAGALTRLAPITRPKDLAADLARHAREAKRRLARHDTSLLAPLQSAMEQALGLHFSGDEGNAFFQSSLVQTLFYGLFSGWMIWRQTPRRSGEFDWKDASDYLALPLIGDLYEEIARPKRLADLDLREPLEWATTSLARVDVEEFFARFDADHAITLFYEPFLEAFDPVLRKELGVWYTPPEIVHYMVERIDELLRSELGISDGLADDQVFVLDPAAGTGSYLVAVAKRIRQTLDEQGHGALAPAQVKKALCTRIFGFEILPAPYVVSHLQLGVLLRAVGAPLSSEERCEVYLTSALTGWEPPKEPKAALLFPELQEEAERASEVKRSKPILVILGNPPYNRFAGVAEDEEADLIEPYKRGLYEDWGIRKQLLDDLYIRFYRLAEKRIAEVGGRGIVSYISNYSWLDGLSHPVMREHLATNFDTIWIDNCNGDKYRTGKRTPDGLPDESMFTTDKHRVGIQVGTAISFLVRRTGKATARDSTTALVHYRELWGTGNAKRAMLTATLRGSAQQSPQYAELVPRKAMRWVFVPTSATTTNYEEWPSLATLFPTHYSGLNENRQGALLSDDAGKLERRMRRYFESNVSDEDIASECPAIMTKAAGYDPRATRRSLLAGKERFDPNQLLRLAYRPFDDIWVYWVGKAKLLNRPRPDFREQVWPGNRFLSASQTGRKGGFNIPTIVDKFGDLHLQDPWSQFFPLYIRRTGELLGESKEPNVNRSVLETLCAAQSAPVHAPDGHSWSDEACNLAEQVFYHTLAVLWSTEYRQEHAASLRQDWPRIPIPSDPQLLNASALLGRQVADLLLPDQPVRGVTAGTIRKELRDVAVPTKVGSTSIDPDMDLKIEAGYGFFGQRKAVMCGKGRVVLHPGEPEMLDIYLNDKVYWSRVPNDVWTLTIGGYPVVKKWLSYREFKVLGRPLRLEEVTNITEVVRRIKAILLLDDELNASYHAAADANLSVKVS